MEYRVTVTSIVSQRDFGTIFGALLNEPAHTLHGLTLRVRTAARTTLGWPSGGEQWQVRGELCQHPRWGWQIDAESAVRIMPSGRLITAFLAARAPGVGPERAERLWLRFGMDLATVLMDEANIPNIAAVIAPERPNIAPGLAALCVRTWKDMHQETSTLVWLASQGIDDVALARRVGRILGMDAVDKLRRNPYCLVPVLDWPKLDVLGIKLLAEAGVEAPSRDPRRLVGACDAVVKRHIRDGHTAGAWDTLQAGLSKLLRLKRESPVLAHAMALGVRYGAVLRAGDGWRAPGCARMEEYVLERLLQIQASFGPVRVPSVLSLERLTTGREVGGRPLHPEQAAAVLQVLQMPLACLQGGAGVGKTSVAKVICDLWEQCGGQLMLATVSGKAALQISRATGRLAMTVARWRLQLERREQLEQLLDSGEPDKAARSAMEYELERLPRLTASHLVLIDEASMLDLVSAHALLRLMPPGARLLLVGDDGQLPPVGFGLIYHRLVEDRRITARLSVIHRHSEASGIPAVATAIRAGTMPVLRNYDGPGEGVSLLECSFGELSVMVRTVWTTLRAEDSAFPLIVTARNDGDAGIHTLNHSFHELHIDGCMDEVKGEFGEWFSAGEPCVFRRNDYGRGLFNGLMGTVVQVDTEERSVTALFDGYDEPHRIERDDLIDLQLAYAITCHRGQGSQAPCVIIPLYRTRLLDPCWLYTAVTRAQRQVVLIGSTDVLREGLAARSAAMSRKVGFEWDVSHEPPGQVNICSSDAGPPPADAQRAGAI
jgi:exodeoxyribonuclease V alpha subunit